jgi:NADPH:quinone reductase-like Zn-dependent oxidoreductase
MKAVICEKEQKSYELVLREVEKPIPGENEVLVKICAASVNAGDYRVLNMGSIPKRKILGSDVAGIVEAVGKNVTRLEIGDEVVGEISADGLGGFAEYVAVPENSLVLKPKKVTFPTATAVPVAGVAALQALRNKGHLLKGQKILIWGASGGVGTFAIQLAQYFGAEVTAVCSSKKAPKIQALGVSQVTDYTTFDFTANKQRFDLVLLVHANDSLTTYKQMLAKNGICVVIGGSVPFIISSLLLGPILSIGDKKIRTLVAKPNRQDLVFIMSLVENGKIKPYIEKTYQLHETGEAVRYLKEGQASGKVVILVSSDENKAAELASL